MKVKFENVYRTVLSVLCIMLVWSIWATAAQPATNAAPVSPFRILPGMHALTNDSWLTFGLDRVEVLRVDWFGQPLWQYFASLMYVILALLVAKLSDYIIGVQLKKWAAKTQTKIDDILVDLARGPVKVIAFVILLHLGLRAFKWPEWVESFLSKAMYIVVAISLTYVAAKFVDLLVLHWSERATVERDRAFDDQLIPIIRKTIKVFVVVVSVLVTSDNLGVHITSVLASLSIGGIALGLAAQDTLANLFGAVAVFVDKPFRIGDRIKLDAVDGTVETMGLRSTRVRNGDGFLVTIPNKTMGNATITNITRRPTIKTEMTIGITYDTPTEKLQRALAILKEIYQANPKTSDLIVSFNKFADSALNILVVHWWNSADYKEYLNAMQEFNLEIKRRFDAEEIEFAFPTQTHLVKQIGQQSEPPKSV